MRNLHEHLTTGKKPDVNMVADGWTTAPTMCAISGNEEGPRTPDDLPDYMKKLFALDLPRQNRIRRRVEEVVHDPSVARKLQAWYPTWCKRPCFHGEYLSSFNRENVTLVDTDGQGPDNITIDSIVAGGISYPVDLIIFATGFRAPFAGSPASKANMTIRGRNGISMSDQWARAGPSTLHGVLDSNFPNLFLSGPWQAALSPNNLFNTDALALRSAPMAAIIGCTPSYFNVEGELDRVPPEMQSMVSKSGLWGHGIESFVKVLEKWREEGNMEGVEVRT